MTHDELANANAIDAKITEIKRKIEPLRELKERVRLTCPQRQQVIKIQIAEGYMNTPQPEVNVTAFLLFVDSEIERYQREMDELEKELRQYYPKGDKIPINWILNHERMPKEGKGRKAIMDMIADWREEHAETD